MYGEECSLYRWKRHLSTVYGECAGAESYLVNVCDKSASQAHETQLLKHSWDQSHGSLGEKPVVSQSSLLWKPWEGWHFACFHTEVQMAAKPISVSTWGKGGGADRTEPWFCPWHQDAKIYRQLKMDNLREGMWGDHASWKNIKKLEKKEEELFLFYIFKIGIFLKAASICVGSLGAWLHKYKSNQTSDSL